MNWAVECICSYQFVITFDVKYAAILYLFSTESRLKRISFVFTTSAEIFKEILSGQHDLIINYGEILNNCTCEIGQSHYCCSHQL